MVYQHSDVDAIVRFLGDFGMEIAKRTEQKIWFKGYGPDPYVYVVQISDKPKYLGGTFLVESYNDLEKAQALLGSSAIEKLHDAPGGGYQVTVYDNEGFPVNLLYGQAGGGPEKGTERPAKILYNYAQKKTRLGAYQRFSQGPAAVFKLGHFGLICIEFAKTLDFYVRTFNLVPSDLTEINMDGKDVPVGTFLHIDRCEEFSDHHTLFLAGNKTKHVHHCSFEVHDFDTQLLGHQWLEKKGYKLVWGVGCHLLGSQIFDYWWDTSGFMIEHYADGDLVNRDTPVLHVSALDEEQGIWGPTLPEIFMT